MGHPSSEVMSLFAKELGFSNYIRKKSDVCDVFFFVLNKLEANFPLAITKPVIYLRLFTVTFEDHIECPLRVEHIIS